MFATFVRINCQVLLVCPSGLNKIEEGVVLPPLEVGQFQERAPDGCLNQWMEVYAETEYLHCLKIFPPKYLIITKGKIFLSVDPFGSLPPFAVGQF